jgi:hypothetical protein
MTDLTQLQRRAAPSVGDRFATRHWQAVAPDIDVLPRRTLANGIENDDVRAAAYLNDDQIRRANGAWYPADNMHGAGTGMVNWTACGPPREELHMRQMFALRTMAGTSSTRFLKSPADPKLGLHSTPPKPRQMGNIQRIQAGTPTIRRGRQNRLSPSRYTGQSYSQTTVAQGVR